MLVRSRGRMAGWLAAGLLVLGLASPGAGGAPVTRTLAPAAPTFTVNSFQDDEGAAPLDNGVCEFLTGTGTCTLRAAIMKANHYSGGGVTILLPSGTYSLTIPPDLADGEAVGDLNITSTVTIIGAGAATTFIDGKHLDRVFNIGPAARVTISGVTVRGGAVNNTGGGLQNYGTLTLADDVFSGNRTGGGSAGAGFINYKTLALIRSVVENNVADGNGAGVFNDNLSSMQITDSIVRDNLALNGSYGGG